MSYYADLIDKLAVDVLKAAEELDDDRLAETIAQAIGASSPTTEELFRTAVRIRMAEARARRMLEDKLTAHKRTAALSAAAEGATGAAPDPGAQGHGP
jgi:cation transport regulator ChaC